MQQRQQPVRPARSSRPALYIAWFVFAFACCFFFYSLVLSPPLSFRSALCSVLNPIELSHAVPHTKYAISAFPSICAQQRSATVAGQLEAQARWSWLVSAVGMGGAPAPPPRWLHDMARRGSNHGRAGSGRAAIKCCCKVLVLPSPPPSRTSTHLCPSGPLHAAGTSPQSSAGPPPRACSPANPAPKAWRRK